jgi:hypothetical protein
LQEACFDEDELGDQGKSDCQRFRDACAPIGFDVRRCRSVARAVAIFPRKDGTLEA